MDGSTPFQYDEYSMEDLDPYQYAPYAGMGGDPRYAFDPHLALSGAIGGSVLGGSLDPALGSSHAACASSAEHVTPDSLNYPDANGCPSTHGCQEPYYHSVSGFSEEHATPDLHVLPDVWGFHPAGGYQDPNAEAMYSGVDEDPCISTFKTPSPFLRNNTPRSQVESDPTPPVLTGSAAVPSDMIDKFYERVSTETDIEYGSRLLSSLQHGRGVLIYKGVRMVKSKERYWTVLKRYLQAVWSVDALASTEVWGLSGEGRTISTFQLRQYPWKHINAQSEQWSTSGGRNGRHRTIDTHTVAALSAVQEKGLVGDQAIAVASQKASVARCYAKRRARMTTEDLDESRSKQNSAARKRRANETPEAKENRLRKLVEAREKRTVEAKEERRRRDNESKRRRRAELKKLDFRE